MTASETLSIASLKAGLLVACDRVDDARDQLCALDAAAGDGDLGTTLANGFTNVRSSLETDDYDDIGELLKTVGLAISEKAAGTMGILLAGAFMDAGRETGSISTLDPSQIADLLKSITASVSKRGGVAPGQRTVVDAMDAAAQAASSAAKRGFTSTETLSEAARGANVGAQHTAEMEPQVGRAGWIAERARGNLDAGAVAWAIILAGWADGVTSGRPSGSG